MKETIQRLEELVSTGLAYIAQASEAELSLKPRPEKWSKKEIIGHLIDSGLNNLQRFTEIQFERRPYKIRNYKQAELVSANDYQHASTEEIAVCWSALNARIRAVMMQQSEETLAYTIVLGAGKTSDLRFLMTDYVDHLEYHLSQVIK